MIETVFLDLDNTILDFTHAEAVALRRALMETGLPAEDSVLARYHAINQRQWELLEAGILTREQVLTTRFELLFQELDVQADPRSVCDRYEGYLAEGHFLIPGALELLQELAPRYDLYLASNGAAVVQHSRLKKAGIGAYFKGVFISEEVGCNKPGKAFFDRCFAAIPGFDRKMALMVGDSLTSDIQGGINAGIRTCLYCPEGEPSRRDIIPDFVIRRLGELPPLLETL